MGSSQRPSLQRTHCFHLAFLLLQAALHPHSLQDSYSCQIALNLRRYGVAVSVDTACNLPNEGVCLTYPTMMILSPGKEAGGDPEVDHAHGCRLAWSADVNTVQVRRGVFSDSLRHAPPQISERLIRVYRSPPPPILQNPIWEDGLQPFTEVTLSDATILVVVLWKTKSGGTPTMVGWGVLPVAVHSNFVNFGRFQIPLYKGALDKATATALVSTPSKVRFVLRVSVFYCGHCGAV